MQTIAITAIVLTYNEEINLPVCLNSVDGFCPVFVVDSGSTDRTVELAIQHGAQVFQHKYENHARQWQWAIENLPVESEWILALDADFEVSDKLKQRLLNDLASVPDQVNGIYIRHRYMFAGGKIRFGGTKHNWLRIIRKGNVHADLSDLVDFRFTVYGDTITWPEVITEYNRYDDDISTWTAKQEVFSLRLAVEEELRREGSLSWESSPSLFGNTDQRITWLRDKWLHLPLFLRPAIYFLYRYIFALGFLDGKAGFLYHTLQALWLRVCVDWKILQLRKAGISASQLENFKLAMLRNKEGSVDKILNELHADIRNK